MRDVLPLLLALFATACGGGAARAADPPAVARALEYRRAPQDNPLRGLVPYVTADARTRFPHSMEFRYFAFSDLMPRAGEFDWSALEETLELVRSRRCQLIARVYLEYPGRPSGIPRYLVDEGLEVTRWESEEGDTSATPDYEDPRLLQALREFIAAFGARYDGDPRLACLTAGLLGSWGEWHTYPREELWASHAVQRAVLDAFEAAFDVTPVLLRYPAVSDHPVHAANAERPFGYHDDSFAWATLDTGREEDSWYFVPLLEAAGARDRWRTRPIGGELRPELWTRSFTADPHPEGQDFIRCVEETHVTWLMDSGLFEERFPLPAARRERALAEVARMGYELHVRRVERGRDWLRLTVENRGVAPFYADWRAELAAFEGARKVWSSPQKGWRLREVLPGAQATWTAELPPEARGAELRVRVPHPMSGGRPLRFANADQQGEWLHL